MLHVMAIFVLKADGAGYVVVVKYSLMLYEQSYDGCQKSSLTACLVLNRSND